MIINKITLTPIFKYNQYSNIVINNPSREQAEALLKEQLSVLSQYGSSNISKAEKRAKKRHYESLPQSVKNLIPKDVYLKNVSKE